jgi:hypothetical protein
VVYKIDVRERISFFASVVEDTKIWWRCDIEKTRMWRREQVLVTYTGGLLNRLMVGP